MNCQQVQEWMDAYLDGELDLANSLAFERHLTSCISCQAAKARTEALVKVVNKSGLYATAPAGLKERIQASLPPTPVQQKSAVPVWRWGALAAGVALVATSVALLEKARQGTGAESVLAREVVASHVRSLMANHLSDVVSTDQHTVKPWFNGKLDFAPVVKDEAAQGFPLVGGRLDYLNEKPVAALVYRRDSHPINVFEWPERGDLQPELKTIRGYNLIHWAKSGMSYWAISDLNARDLHKFVDALQQ